MASPKISLVFFLAAAALVVPLASAAKVYCRDSLGGLQACNRFMFEGTPAASPGCCDAYGAAFNADPFCLCYIANGVYGRSTGFDVNVTRALEIPTSCGQVQPPIQFCGMQGVELPPLEPETTGASPPSPSPASAWSPPRSSPARDVTARPPPPPTSNGGHDSSVHMAVLLFTVAAAMVAAGDIL